MIIPTIQNELGLLQNMGMKMVIDSYQQGETQGPTLTMSLHEVFYLPRSYSSPVQPPLLYSNQVSCSPTHLLLTAGSTVVLFYTQTTHGFLLAAFCVTHGIVVDLFYTRITHGVFCHLNIAFTYDLAEGRCLM